MSGISFNVAAEHSSPFFGRLVVSNIHSTSGPAQVQRYLYVKFTSPARIGNSDVNVVTHPWVDITPNITNQQIAPNLYNVVARLHFRHPYTFNGTETITFYVNGDLGRDPEEFTDTFILSADQILT